MNPIASALGELSMRTEGKPLSLQLRKRASILLSLHSRMRAADRVDVILERDFWHAYRDFQDLRLHICYDHGMAIPLLAVNGVMAAQQLVDALVEKK